jgi:hypothetical protein
MECAVCCEKLNKSNFKPVECGFCTDFIACVTCVKRYLLETTQNAHCMNCKHEWSRVDLINKLPKTFILNEYKKRRQDLIEERERSMMPATQPYVEIQIATRNVLNIVREINQIRSERYNKQISAITDEYLKIEIDIVRKEHKIRCINHDIQCKERALRIERGRYRAQFIRQCPMPDCRGFLSTAWKCGLCDTHVCSKCHEPRDGNEIEERDENETEEQADNEIIEQEGNANIEQEGNVIAGQADNPNTTNKPKHVCNPNNVETAKLLKSDTKPCPKCACMIFKISGCDQMFCTQCHTAFSWTTGAIETRIIHNPHYFQYLREQANGAEIPRNPLDNPCEDIMPDGQAFNYQMAQYILAQVNNIPSFMIEIINNDTGEVEHKSLKMQEIMHDEIRWTNHVVANNLQAPVGMNANSDLRIKYMMNDITEEKYKQLLQIREKKQEKDREFDMIFRTYVTAARDIILNYVNLPTTQDRITKRIDIYNELKNLRNYINECFVKLRPVFNCTVWHFVEKKRGIDLVKI